MKKNTELYIGLAVGFVICLIISIIFVFPVFKGKELSQGDITQYKGSAQEIKTYAEQGEQILWTNSMFSGMPAYMVSTKYKGNIFSAVHSFFRTFLPHPVSLIFLMMINFFILLLAMRVDPWLSLGGAVAFAFSTYFIVILAAGHNAKVDAVMWLPGVLAGIYLAYRRNLWIGAAVFGFYLVMELKASHPQMAYYFAFLAIAFVITEAVGLALEGKFFHFAKASALLGLMAMLAIGANWSYLKTTSDYSKYSIRGTSELTANASNKTKGLDRDYVTQWSNGIDETWTFLVPNFKGGESADISKNKTAVKALKPNEKKMLQGNAYFGDQPFTGGPVYVGAGVFLLFLLALFFVKDRLKWPLLAATIFTIMISWGKNFPRFTNFMLDHFPLYDKFRAIISAVIVPEMVFPILAFLGLAYMVANPDFFKKKATLFGAELPFTNHAVFLGISGTLFFILVLMWLVPSLFTGFYATGEYQDLIAQLVGMGASEAQAADYAAVLETGRKAIFRADVMRSLIYMLLTAGLVWSFGYFKYSRYILAIGIFLITAVDLLSVNKRYLNENNFVAKNNLFPKSTADAEILRDKDLSYRVLNLSVSPFNDASTSYYHKSIGGYHGAKLKKYQEMIEYGITPEIENMFTVFRAEPTQEKINAALQSSPALNMLNARYLIINPQAGPLVNPYALGNVWFPSTVKWVDNADAEMEQTMANNPGLTAVIDKKFESELGGISLNNNDSVSTIKLTAYHPEKLEYEANAVTDKIAVFSEIWYPEGWVCFIDGKETPIGRSNYLLRAVKVPAGQHKIELVFAPRFNEDEKVSLAFSVLLLLVCLGMAGKEAFAYFKANKA